VRFQVDGAVARVTLDRPGKRNAQRPELWHALADFAETLSSEVRVVVVTGSGPSFSAGLDREMFGTLAAGATTADDSFLEVIASYQAGFAWLRRPEFISIAAVQGHAVGAGFQLALACDIRIAATDAQFTMAEPSLGLVPDLGGTQVLVDTIGYSRAVEICATGRRVDAGEADRIGLVNLVVPSEQLGTAVEDLIAALTSPVHGAVTMTKALLLGARNRTYQQQLLAERQAQLARIRALAPKPDSAESAHGSHPQP
jgi:enoyl-CoA hydratase/carnithine racemase